MAKSDGGEPHRLLTAGGTASDIRWSPDGSILRFTVNDPKTNYRSIWQASADGSNLHPLLPGWSDAPNECCGKWTPDGKYFVFQARRDATTDLWAINERGGFFRATPQAAGAVDDWPNECRQSRPQPRWQEAFRPGLAAPRRIVALRCEIKTTRALPFGNFGDGARLLSRWRVGRLQRRLRRHHVAKQGQTERKSFNLFFRPCRPICLDGLRTASKSLSLVIHPASPGKSM